MEESENGTIPLGAVVATGIHTSGQPRNYRVSQLPIATCWFVGFVGWFWEFGKLQQWWQIRKARCFKRQLQLEALWQPHQLQMIYLKPTSLAIMKPSACQVMAVLVIFRDILVRTPSPPRPWLWASPLSCMVSLGGSDEVFSLVQ